MMFIIAFMLYKIILLFRTFHAFNTFRTYKGNLSFIHKIPLHIFLHYVCLMFVFEIFQ